MLAIRSRICRAAVLTATAAAALSLAIAAAASAATAGRPQCAGQPQPVTFSNLTEKVVKLVDDVPPSGPVPGDTGSYHDNLYNAHGDLIGTADGTTEILYKSQLNGDLYSVYEQKITLPGGTIQAIGLVDTADESASRWVTIAAWGTSGRYLGLVGTRSWKALSHKLADASITLNPAP